MKAKKIDEIHSEAEKNLGLRPGAAATIRNGRGIAGGFGGLVPGGFPINRPGAGGMMPGMPGARRMPGMPGLDNDDWEVVPRTRSMPKNEGQVSRIQAPLSKPGGSFNSKLLPQGSAGFMAGKTSALLQGSGGDSLSRPSNLVTSVETQSTVASRTPTPITSSVIPAPVKPVTHPSARTNPTELRKKTISLLEEYFSVRILDEALQCVEELNSPDYYPEFVKEAISLALEKIPPLGEPLVKLLEYLLAKKVLVARDIGTGCLLYGSMLDDIGIDLPKAPNNFGELMGKLIVIGGLDFKLLKEVLKKMEDPLFQRVVFDAAVKTIGSYDATGQNILASNGDEIKEIKETIA